MRKSLVSLFIVAVCAVAVTYCSSNNNGGGNVAVTGVDLNKTSTALCVGQGSTTETLYATVSPSDATNKNVTWSTSASSVATVGTDGTVTPVAAGSATITVTTADGNKTATCTVTVYAECVAVNGVTLNKDTLTVAVDGSEQLSATIAPANATNQSVTWSSSNDSVATVSNAGVVTGISAGNATITVTTAQGSFTDTCAVTVLAAGTISCTIANWVSFLNANPNITAPKVKIVIKPKNNGGGQGNEDPLEIVSDSYSLDKNGNGSFTLTPNANPSGNHLYLINTVSWNSVGLSVNPTTGVNLLVGPNSSFEAKIAIYDDSTFLEYLDISPSGSGGNVDFWYDDASVTVNGTIDKTVTGGDYSMTFSNVTFPAGWSFSIFTVTGADTETVSVATSGGANWTCNAYSN